MRVLLVESDAAAAEWLCRGLELDGHEVERVGGGAAVLRCMADVTAELVIVDLGGAPFSLMELRAGVTALDRRMAARGVVLRFGDLEMDRAARQVRQAGREVKLTATEFLLLEALLRRRGERTCSRPELLREVWGASQPQGTNIVEVYINYLRRKLNRGPVRLDRGRAMIRTVRGEGYVLEAVGMAERPEPQRRARAAWERRLRIA
jgi:DNA-binding response OmpR family regulator